eukprot:TRINITY_DN13227_c0_g1_i1.p1 TRINITY_DN13227_c0_g1~~TRINITY_DN13227_c0_g1_i1.p1  ORF type:complete len:600 (+),score=120.87 TRINITY_DN13227_c0_g1_i1:73-1872(+)
MQVNTKLLLAQGFEFFKQGEAEEQRADALQKSWLSSKNRDVMALRGAYGSAYSLYMRGLECFDQVRTRDHDGKTRQFCTAKMEMYMSRSEAVKDKETNILVPISVRMPDLPGRLIFERKPAMKVRTAEHVDFEATDCGPGSYGVHVRYLDKAGFAMPTALLQIVLETGMRERTKLTKQLAPETQWFRKLGVARAAAPARLRVRVSTDSWMRPVALHVTVHYAPDAESVRAPPPVQPAAQPPAQPPALPPPGFAPGQGAAPVATPVDGTLAVPPPSSGAQPPPLPPPAFASAPPPPPEAELLDAAPQRSLGAPPPASDLDDLIGAAPVGAPEVELVAEAGPTSESVEPATLPHDAIFNPEYAAAPQAPAPGKSASIDDLKAELALALNCALPADSAAAAVEPIPEADAPPPDAKAGSEVAAELGRHAAAVTPEVCNNASLTQPPVQAADGSEDYIPEADAPPAAAAPVDVPPPVKASAPPPPLPPPSAAALLPTDTQPSAPPAPAADPLPAPMGNSAPAAGRCEPAAEVPQPAPAEPQQAAGDSSVVAHSTDPTVVDRLESVNLNVQLWDTQGAVGVDSQSNGEADLAAFLSDLPQPTDL